MHCKTHHSHQQKRFSTIAYLRLETVIFIMSTELLYIILCTPSSGCWTITVCTLLHMAAYSEQNAYHKQKTSSLEWCKSFVDLEEWEAKQGFLQRTSQCQKDVCHAEFSNHFHSMTVPQEGVWMSSSRLLIVSSCKCFYHLTSNKLKPNSNILTNAHNTVPYSSNALPEVAHSICGSKRDWMLVLNSNSFYFRKMASFIFIR